MNTALAQLGTRLQKGDFHRTLGRFRLFRRSYSLLLSSLQRFRSAFHATPPDRDRLQPRDVSFFSGVSAADMAAALQRDAVSFGLHLPPDMVSAIYQFACETPCTEPGFAGEFYADDVRQGRVNGGRHSFRGLVKDPLACPTVKTLTQDPVLLDIVHRYLSYWPRKMTCHLSWSFAVDLPDAEQKKRYPPLNCHYDVAGYNFMTTYFYITDIDADHGAHVMVKGSHNHKPIRTLFVPGAEPHLAQKVLDYYGADNKLVIEGKAGLGFVQDPSCFHWLRSPKAGRRLLFQIRYA